MRWLKREEGVSLVLVGVMLTAFLGLSGMAVDLGAVYVERRELRTGADAAALAIAEDCGRGTRPCDDSSATQTAERYANANSRDGAAVVESVALTLASDSTGSVRVVTSAWDAAAGKAGVRVPLMSLFGLDRVAVGAAATAIFDHPSSGQSLPLVIEQYCLEEMGQNQSGYVLMHTGSAKGGTGSCQQSEPAGQDAPGAFGWIDVDRSLDPDPILGNCLASFDIDGWETFADPGQGAGSPPKECEASALREAIYQKAVLVAVYSDVRAQGNNTQYFVTGFAAFFVEGYRLGNKQGFYMPPPSGAWDNNICPPSAMCLLGHFTELTVYGANPGGPNYGVVLVMLTE